MAKRLVYTDGVKEMATLCQAWWLVDAIASYVATTQAVQAEEFQTWTLAMSAGKVSLVCTNGNDEVPIVSQLIGYTDFPFGLLPFKLFCRHSEVAGSMAFVLMLPEEH